MTHLPAGPELDRLIAEKVMGWKDLSWNEQHPEDREDCPWMPREWCRKRSDNSWLSFYNSTRPDPEDPTCLWRPSIYIGHTWEVVEQMCLIKPDKHLVLFLNDRKIWVASWNCRGPDYGDHWIDDSIYDLAEAETPSLAICLSALKAVE